MRRHSSKLLKLHLNEKTRMDGKCWQVKGKVPKGRPKKFGKRLPRAIKRIINPFKHLGNRKPGGASRAKKSRQHKWALEAGKDTAGTWVHFLYLGLPWRKLKSSSSVSDSRGKLWVSAWGGCGHSLGAHGWSTSLTLQSVISHLKLWHTMAPGGIKCSRHKNFNRKSAEHKRCKQGRAEHCLRLSPRCSRMLCLSRDTAAGNLSYKFISEGLSEEGLHSSDKIKWGGSAVLSAEEFWDQLDQILRPHHKDKQDALPDWAGGSKNDYNMEVRVRSAEKKKLKSCACLFQHKAYFAD